MTSTDHDQLGELAVELALGAARRARLWRTEGFTIGAKSTPTDLVTEVDRRVERWIVTELNRRRPADSILGEEGVSDVDPAHPGDPEGPPAAAAVRWLIDPIDGTVNFALGLGQYAISVAAEVDGQVVAGCVVNPASGDVFRAVLGRGAFHHRSIGLDDDRGEATPLAGPRLVSLARAVIGTGFGYDAARRARQGRVVAQLLPRIGDIRRIGAASLDLCSVAAGWLDGHYEAGLNPWDYAAGLLIAAEAGCLSSGLHGRAAGNEFCAVAGPDLAADLFAVLTELEADGVLTGDGR
jgi:myo-inositol-1(or 4)-monophosphatase